MCSTNTMTTTTLSTTTARSKTKTKLMKLAKLSPTAGGGGRQRDRADASTSSSASSSANTQVTPTPSDPNSPNAAGTSQASPYVYTYQQLLEMAQTLQRHMKIKDRTYRFKTYRKVFVGRQAIDFLVDRWKLPSRDAAIQLGGQMNQVLHCYEYVSKVTLDKTYTAGVTATVYGSSSSDPDQVILLQDSDHAFYRFTDFTAAAKLMSRMTLEDIMRAFQRGVRVQDRTFFMKTYNKVFIGSEAVDFLVSKKLAASRAQAVQLGRRLAKEYDLFVHITGEHELKDDYFFYRMLTPTNVTQGIGAPGASKKEDKRFMQIWIVSVVLVATVIYYTFY